MCSFHLKHFQRLTRFQKKKIENNFPKLGQWSVICMGMTTRYTYKSIPEGIKFDPKY